MKVWIWRFTRHFVIGCPEATNQYRIAVIVVLSLTAEFINQRDHETKDINQNKGMPRHQLYRLACQRPFDVRDKLVKSRICWARSSMKRCRAQGHALNHQETADTPAYQFARNYFSGNYLFGVPDPICYGCHSSFALFHKCLERVFFGWCVNRYLRAGRGVIPNSPSIARIRFRHRLSLPPPVCFYQCAAITLCCVGVTFFVQSIAVLPVFGVCLDQQLQRFGIHRTHHAHGTEFFPDPLKPVFPCPVKCFELGVP